MNIPMCEKWVKTKKLSEDFVSDITKFGEYVAREYKESIKMDVRLRLTEDGSIIFGYGFNDYWHGYMEISTIFRVDAKRYKPAVIKPIITKHRITLCAIAMLLNKYGYSTKALGQDGEDFEHDAQIQLINLELI